MMPGRTAAVYAGVKRGRERAQRSKATAVRPGSYATSVSTKPASKGTCRLEDSSSIMWTDKDSRREDQHARATTSKDQQSQRAQQHTTESCYTSVRCGCGTFFSDGARFCEKCGSPHPSVARAEMRAKDASRPPALQRAAAAAHAPQQEHVESPGRAVEKVSQGCTGCSMM